ncbi:MAG: bifunctional rhamnulose-1-phosphate aldolase/short-chain dehydrogenase [Planctomycetota bacterium]|nr:bifunctional rhamnulose-1-phosphate aldolase/short-chain dehydrogenase [Planctomycetota bacterium]
MTSLGSSPFVKHLWNDEDVVGLDGVDRLVYRSNRLGDDQRITNTGGGNTSSKLDAADPITGRPTRVLWVKGSGGDLRTAGRANFASLDLERLESLKDLYASRPVTGIKTEAEDEMVDLYRDCVFARNPRASSIDTPLHAFVPAAHVDHTHPNAVIAIAASERGEEVAREIYGAEVPWLPWMRPGFELGLALERLCLDHPEAGGAILGQHGLINWHEDDRACYERSLEYIDRAARYLADHDRGAETFGGTMVEPVEEDRRREILVELLPWLRGRVSARRRMIATVQADDATLAFVSSADAARLAALGTSCPDHFLRTKIRPLFVDWNPSAEDVATLKERLEAGLADYVRDYSSYYEACRHDDSPAIRPPEPTVVLVPGVGMVAFGASKSESRTTAEFYRCAIEVMRGAESIGGYKALPQQEAFDIEYWRLEEAKLQRMPKARPFAGRVVLVAGAGSGIGRECALEIVDDDATVVCLDLDGDAAAGVAGEIEAKRGSGIGVAGSGVSGCGPAIGLQADATSRPAVREAIADAIIAYGGIDDLVVTAGMFPTPGPDGRVPDDVFARTFAVNVQAPAILAEEVAAMVEDAALDGSIVLTTSVNAVVAKKGSSAYDASKAAANHLVRSMAVGFAPRLRVNAVAPATVIEGSTMFPRDRVMSSLRKYDIPFEESMSDERLVELLGSFYASRTLLNVPISPRDQVAAIRFLLGPEASRTTGQVLHVDGGLADAFVR